MKEGRMVGSGKWALTVNELEPGKFHFSVLVAVNSPDDFLSFRPVLTDDKAFSKAASALALCVSRVILICLDVGFDELRCHQADSMTHSFKLACPVVGATASFHADETRRQIDKERCYLVASKLLLQHSLAVLVDPVDPEHVLCQWMPTVVIFMVDGPFGSSGW
jgi:hypothetical protein